MAATVSVPVPAYRRRVDVESPLEPGRRSCVRVRARRHHGTRDRRVAGPTSPDHALRFTAIRASERFRGRVALPAPSGPLPRSAVTNASARNAGHDAPGGPIRPRPQSTKRPASTSRRALNSPNWTRTSDMRVNSSPLYQLSYRGKLGAEVYRGRCRGSRVGRRAGSLERDARELREFPGRPARRPLRAASRAARSARARPGAGEAARARSRCRRRSGGSPGAGSARVGSRSPCC